MAKERYQTQSTKNIRQLYCLLIVSFSGVLRKGQRMRNIFVIAALSVIGGCANINVSQPVVAEFEKSKTYSMNYEKVWARAVDWFADHNVTIEKIEKDSGLLTAKYLIETNDNYLDCGQIKATGLMSDPNIERYGSLNLTVRQVDVNSTKVNVNFFGEFKLAGNDAWDGRLVTTNGKCVSTGNLEKSVLSYIGS